MAKIRISLPKKPSDRKEWMRMLFNLVGTCLELYIIWLFLTEYKPYMDRITTCELYYQEKLRANFENFNISWQQNMSWDDLIESNISMNESFKTPSG